MCDLTVDVATMERSVVSRGTTCRNSIHPHNLFENEMITKIKHFKRQRKQGGKRGHASGAPAVN